MSISTFIETRRQLKRARNILTDKEFAIYKALANNPLGLLPEEVEEITGYHWCGWIGTSLKNKGYPVHIYSGLLTLSE